MIASSRSPEWRKDPMNYSNINTYWGHLSIEALRESGVTRFVISPGSRSTPLTFACSQISEIEVEVVVDERSAAFFALGWSKSAGRSPVALICTSGSALAHYLPAMIEARYGHIPLLILSADRPPELQECHAGQTINQSSIFGNYAFEELEAPIPDLSQWPEYFSQLSQLATRLRLPASYGCHINQAFRDPLTPGVTDGSSDALQLYDSKTTTPEVIIDRRESSCPKASVFGLSGRNLIVLGPGCYDEDIVEAVSRTLDSWQKNHLGVILCDGLSSVRFSGIKTIAHYDVYLRDLSRLEDCRPEQIYFLGDVPTSKVLRNAIDHWGARNTVIAFDTDRRDAGIPGDWNHVSLRDASELVQLFNDLKPTKAHPDFVDAWDTADTRVSTALQKHVHPKRLVEWQIPRFILPAIKVPSDIWISSSMPVRDWEAFAPAERKNLRVFVNRGANGIDGIIASAIGMARGVDRQSILIIGDVAFAHDVGSLALLRSQSNALTIIVIDNAGGRIFEHLPISKVNFNFEKFFLTAPQINFAKLAEAYGIAFVEISTPDHLSRVVQSVPESHRILWVRTDSRTDIQERTAFIQSLIF